jgi:diguanylate cyclase (GGDEF)-like protein
MKQTDLTLLEQMRITALEVESRKELLGFTRADAENLMRFRAPLRDGLADMLAVLYERQTAIDEIAVAIGDADTLHRMQEAERAYVLDFFEGDYGIGYVERRLHIGLVLKRIGIDPRLYLAAMKILKDMLFERLAQCGAEADEYTAAQRALDKLFYFDIALVFETYVRCMVAEIELGKDRVVRYARALEQRVAERTADLENISRLDPLTGLLNRRVLAETLHREIRVAERSGRALCLAYFDLDDFKEINDTHGHERGDTVLKGVAGCLREVSRDVDVIFRLGGDEFCVLLTDSTEALARNVYCERLSELVARRLDGLRMSIGVAQTGPGTYDEPEALIRRADAAMYEAKRHAKALLLTAPMLAVAAGSSPR